MSSKKDIDAVLFLKDGCIIKAKNVTETDTEGLIRGFNNNCLDGIICFDLSEDDEEHEKNLHLLKEINRISEIPVIAGGNIKRLEDVKKILYTGCKKAIIDYETDGASAVAVEAKERFGRERLASSVRSSDTLVSYKDSVSENTSELFVLYPGMYGKVSGITDLPYTVRIDGSGFGTVLEVLEVDDTVKGVFSQDFNRPDADIALLKSRLKEEGIFADCLCSSLSWDQFKLNGDGMVPVIVQDYENDEVLMLAYMNEESFNKTLETGIMTYYSRSRDELWIKGLTSGHYQYVKSLKIDCDKDTILARVSQLGAACHTGKRSCFYTDLVNNEVIKKNSQDVFEGEFDIIMDRKLHPKEGSYTNYLFDKGIDKILKKVGEEASEVIIAAKNPDPEEIKYEVADLLYHVMVMMAERGIEWDEVVDELSKR